MAGFIQGYISTLTVNGQTLEIYASDATLSLTNETLDKTTLGVSNRQYIPGLQDGTIDMTLHLHTDAMAALYASFSSTVPVSFVFRPGALGDKDAGQWAGDCIISDLPIAGAVDDNWSVSLSCQVTGPVAYTAPV